MYGNADQTTGTDVTFRGVPHGRYYYPEVQFASTVSGGNFWWVEERVPFFFQHDPNHPYSFHSSGCVI